MKGLIIYKEIDAGHGSFLFGKNAPSIWGDLVLNTLQLLDSDSESVKSMNSNPIVEEMEIYDKPKTADHVIRSVAEEEFYRRAEDHLKAHLGE